MQKIIVPLVPVFVFSTLKAPSSIIKSNGDCTDTTDLLNTNDIPNTQNSNGSGYTKLPTNQKHDTII